MASHRHDKRAGRDSTTHLILTRDLPASVVVFLVALPLCVGVAVASGVPAELGLVTGIVGGLITGVLPGSSLQVSGPAAGLTVLVAELVHSHGLVALGPVVLCTGLAQVTLGALRLGRWFRAISISVVEGMLAGIGLVIITGQVWTMAATKAPADAMAKIYRLPELVADLPDHPTARATLGLGVATLAVLAVWGRLPAQVRILPGPLAAVFIAAVLAGALHLSAPRVRVGDLWAAIHPLSSTSWNGFLRLDLLGTVVAFTLVASAESLFSAAAVDRLHDGPRTHFDKELVAQGVGNTVCGLLGALPLTAVIVRSSANVRAGARTKVSRILHGVWLLSFAAALPQVLRVIPVAALAAVLVNAGWKLLPLKVWRPLWRTNRGEAVILAITAGAIWSLTMFEGVLIGLGLSIAKAAWETSHVTVRVDEETRPGPLHVRLEGSATFLRLPRILDALEALPPDRPVTVDLTGLRHRDHAFEVATAHWLARRLDASLLEAESRDVAPAGV